MFTEDKELYDRCIMSHTTFIPYREFERVLGVVGIDDYIRYGGTMSPSGKQYNDSLIIFVVEEVTENVTYLNVEEYLKRLQ